MLQFSLCANYYYNTCRSNRRVSVLVTVLDKDDRVNSDNFEDRLKISLMKHLSAEHFQLLNATVYGKNIIAQSLIITNSLFIFRCLSITEHSISFRQ